MIYLGDCKNEEQATGNLSINSTIFSGTNNPFQSGLTNKSTAKEKVPEFGR